MATQIIKGIVSVEISVICRLAKELSTDRPTHNVEHTVLGKFGQLETHRNNRILLNLIFTRGGRLTVDSRYLSGATEEADLESCVGGPSHTLNPPR